MYAIELFYGYWLAVVSLAIRVPIILIHDAFAIATELFSSRMENGENGGRHLLLEMCMRRVSI